MIVFADIIGAIGVALLLVAFVLNLLGRLDSDARAYAALNLVGAGLSCFAAVLIEYVPFVVLEGVWAAVALTGLIQGPRHRRDPGRV